ncbi:hypothetical protein PV11_08894 [Exophiala sideris]|uniref:Glutathione S-transferase n=1 Tax=Exophiala sideris TaxID=1016849 RepID=A0A0D1YQ13_9EURO|nr:hypothetical protein PV11_08894 [Exophiala sideris]
MGSSKAQFTLHTHVTCPAAFKVAHVLSLLGLEYEPIYFDSVRITRGEKLKWFAALNPNGRSPVLIDHAQNDHVVWESTAILLYLVTLYDTEHKLYPKDVFEQSKVNQWMMLQASGQGPTMGQAFWFGYWHDEVLPSAYKRYVDETKRILNVLEIWLKERKWLVGEKMSIADVSYFSWYEEAYLVDVDLAKEFPAVNSWFETMKALPVIVAGSVGREMIKPKKLWERDDYKQDQAS